MSERLGLRRLVGLTTSICIALALVLVVPGAFATTGAVSTTQDPGFVGATYTAPAEACLNGHGNNCNIYMNKADVFLSGLPVSASLGAGTYFFAVLVPGGQHDPNDGSLDNLSDPSGGDAWTERVFTTDGAGNVTYSASHDFDATNNMIRLMPYDDTTNNGGVYIMAVCQIDPATYDPAANPVDPSSCKYDAFKVKGGPDVNPPADDLTVSKDATPSFTREFNWSIKKSVDACQVTTQAPNGCQSTSGSKTLNYSVAVTKDAGTDSGWQVNGTIRVSNPNLFDVSGVGVTDAVDNGGSCSVTNGADVTVSGGGYVDLSYTCTYASKPSPLAGNNVATATWPDIGSPHTSANTGNVPFDFGTATPSTIHNSVTLSDLHTTTPSSLPLGFGAALSSGALPSGTISSSQTFTYAYTVTVPHDCLQLNNTAGFSVTDADADADDSGISSVTAKVCRTAARTGALTIGFWQNKNGQGIVSGQAKTGTCPSAIWLRQYAPFQDLSATATCAQTATYVYNVVKAATCGGSTCNAMLKAQMLATALDVYFSDPALGGNKIGAFSGLGTAQPKIGTIVIDLKNVCAMLDGTGGTATCSGTYEDASPAFGGAQSLTVSQMLAYAASQSDSGGIHWYGNAKATQVLAKDAFDAINNQVAFSV